MCLWAALPMIISGGLEDAGLAPLKPTRLGDGVRMVRQLVGLEGWESRRARASDSTRLRGGVVGALWVSSAGWVGGAGDEKRTVLRSVGRRGVVALGVSLDDSFVRRFTTTVWTVRGCKRDETRSGDEVWGDARACRASDHREFWSPPWSRSHR